MTLFELLTDFRLILLLIIATVVGVVAGVIEFKLGNTQREVIFEHTDKLTPEMLERFQRGKDTLGSPLLIFSGFPLIGPPLSIAAGVMDFKLGTYILWGTIGRLISNTLLVLIFGQTALWIGRLISG